MVFAAGAVTVWLCAPPSDHFEKKYLEWLNHCGDRALTVFAEPMTTLTENGVLCLASFTTRWRTASSGRVWNLSTTVFGFSRTLVVEVSPPESVAVTCSSSQHGYWWSGALNDPLRTPVKFATMCVWQLVGVKQ